MSDPTTNPEPIVEPVTEPTPIPEPAKMYTQADLDRAVTKAVKTREQNTQVTVQDLQRQLTELETARKIDSNKAKAEKQLLSKGFKEEEYAGILGYLVTDEEETTLRNIDVFATSIESRIQTQVQEELAKKLKNTPSLHTPPAEPTKTDWDKLTATEVMLEKAKDPEGYQAWRDSKKRR